MNTHKLKLVNTTPRNLFVKLQPPEDATYPTCVSPNLMANSTIEVNVSDFYGVMNLFVCDLESQVWEGVIPVKTSLPIHINNYIHDPEESDENKQKATKLYVTHGGTEIPRGFTSYDPTKENTKLDNQSNDTTTNVNVWWWVGVLFIIAILLIILYCIFLKK